jgi:hypothetical protein
MCPSPSLGGESIADQRDLAPVRLIVLPCGPATAIVFFIVFFLLESWRGFLG